MGIVTFYIQFGELCMYSVTASTVLCVCVSLKDLGNKGYFLAIGTYLGRLRSLVNPIVWVLLLSVQLVYAFTDHISSSMYLLGTWLYLVEFREINLLCNLPLH